MEQLQEIVAIANASFPDPWSEGLFQQAIFSCTNQVYTAVTVENKVVGYVVLSHAGDAVSLDDIAVAPTARKMGIGQQLMEFIQALYPNRTFWLEVRANNTAAQNLYQKNNYRESGRRKNYYRNPTEDAILMTRDGEESIC